MQSLHDAVSSEAERTGFSGVVRVDRGDVTEFERAYGLAHRSCGTANTIDTRFATASATKGFTALAVMSLVKEGALALSTTARSVLGADLPLIDDAVTVEQLLAHRSGIGDYLDEDDEELDLDDYLLARPVHELVDTEDFLPLLEGHPSKFEPGTRFSYCNGGYVVLALIAERVSATPYADLVHTRVVGPAGMVDTAFSRSDELPPRTALGYLHTEGPRTNVFHLPVRGNGDGGIYTTAADMVAFWAALYAGRIVSEQAVVSMLQPRSEVPQVTSRYGLGFWLADVGEDVRLDGGDTGVSFRSVTNPATRLTYTVIANTTEGAWPVARYLRVEYAAQTQ